jgi:uroporphyrinogen-III decarboxylase
MHPAVSAMLNAESRQHHAQEVITMGKYEDNLELLRKTVRCEPTDRVPFVPCGNAYMARANHILMKDYITDFDLACDANIKELKRIDADGTQNVIFSPYLLGTQWLSKTAIPGVDLDDDAMWQITEIPENMKFEDYQKIKDMGWEAWQAQFIHEKCDDNWNNLKPFFEANPRSYKKFYEAGIPCICDFLMITPFEYFCGGRSLEAFLVDDLFDEPELMHEIFDLVMESNLKTYRKQIEDTHALGVWIGGWRTGPDLISPDMFDEFVWPYFKGYYDLCIEMNVIPMFHLDSNWDLLLDRFKQLPEKTYVMALDSKTDIRKCRQVLGPNVCILGDVPCEMLTFGTAQEVYDYVTAVLDDIGPWGVMVASGCDIPSDAKPENVLAMSRAAHEYLEHHPQK